ncbi:MAG: amidohydrolase family protein [Candidatus Eisenbacteria bacterium]|nr:amidohydrolase family protein [Candidatus Eisenbacteria bacterium]
MPRAPRLLAISACLLLSNVLPVTAVTIYDIQHTTDPSGGSPYAGQVVTVSGIVAAVFLNGYVVAEAPGPWRAVYVGESRNGPEIGDEITITGTVDEYSGKTEIRNVTDYSVISTGNDVAPWPVRADSAAQEKYESVLVILDDLTVTSLLGGGWWAADDGSGTIQCADTNDYTYFPELGDTLVSVAGIVRSVSSPATLHPRDTMDISGHLIPHFALGGTIITMNDALDILHGHYVEIRGDRILGITDGAPRGLLIVETQGLIFPGLIDAHNHARFNVLDHIPFEQTFEHRDQWRSTEMYAEFTEQFTAILDYPAGGGQIMNLYRLAETRALSAGTTTMQSINCNGQDDDFFAHQGMVINNAERFPSRIWSETFPLPLGPAYWHSMQEGCFDRFVIHLSEGTNDASLQEFYTWASWGMLDWRTTLIHGVSLGPNEWALMADASANLVWSPMSNMLLYGTTADIPSAVDAGVDVSIAPDWTPSGSHDMLAEMKFGRELSDAQWGGVLDPVDLVLFATRNAARAMGAENRIGQVAEGFRADLMVIPASPQDPYEALLDAESRDVMLTVVSGRPMYGDPWLMDQFPFLGTVEEVQVGGCTKRVAIQIETHSIPDSDVPISEVVAELEQAYDQAYPRVCEFLGPFEGPPTRVPDPPWAMVSSLRVTPNPFRAAATVVFSVPRRLDASLRVYAVDGRLLRNLLHTSLAAGSHTLTWDGSDDRGLYVASGVYLLRLESGGWEHTTRVLLLQ